MIVITSLMKSPKYVCAGDRFQLTVSAHGHKDVVISEDITYNGVIDFAVSFRFADDKGRCIGFHLSGFFGCKDNLPKEMKEAKMFEDLKGEQRRNFIKTCGTVLYDGE